MNLNLISGPETEVVSLAEAKAHARIPVDLTDDDSYVQSLIAAARQKVESLASIYLGVQTWELILDGFAYGGGYYNRDVRRNLAAGDPGWLPGHVGAIEIPNPPLRSILAIEYEDSTGNPRTIDPSAYRVVRGTPSKVAPAYGAAWPSDVAATAGAVAIRFECGHAPESAPAVAKLAICQLVAHWYDRREPVVTATVSKIPYTVESILDAVDWGAY